jgi:hypothetical protein
MDDTRIPPHDDSDDSEERPHGCYRGVIFVGHMVEDEAGGEVEVFEAFPCRRCAEEEEI